jgi:TRAP-type C4-dicarboxylate transport system substrate-binding protein
MRRYVRLKARTNRKHKVAGMSRPFQIRMGGYGPATTCFSLALKMIGDRLTAAFGDDVDIKYVWNIMDLGYRAEDILWLVEHGLLTLGYQSSSYLTDRVPALGIVDLPFLFESNGQARGAMDGPLGDILAREIEARVNYRILGWFENGFRHVSNRLRPVHTPADLAGMRIRVLPSQVQAKTFELLGAIPLRWDLTEAITAIKAGTIDAQENPFANTVTYGVHNYHRYHTLTNHFYISRPIFLNRTAFDGWPEPLQRAMREAVAAAVRFQRELAVVEDRQARAAIEEKHCELVELTSDQHDAFAAAVKPIYGDARQVYAPEILALVPRPI